ncbi:MAG: hypothetical protein GEU89_02985 [Kiloniellaceae bacterium]|nr:hypothetical protein [Kiloniellaceae bacterium]
MFRALLHGFFATVLFCLAALPGLAAAQAAGDDGAGDGYVAGIADLPLMPGLKALPDSGLVFDKPGGRIVEAFAEGAMTRQSVVAFYDETLPQLGWQREAPGAYLREGERLKLDLSQDARGITVHFRLFPQ